MALTMGIKEIQGHAAIIFALPFVLFSAWAGWLADRLPKTSIVVWAKVLELVAMCFGAYGLITLNWNFILAMVGTMGLQSTIFSPALNGSIPETFPSKVVPKVNAVLKLATTVTILMGIALAGFCLDQKWGQDYMPEGVVFGHAFVSAIAIAAAAFGLLAAIFLSRSKIAAPNAKFPLAGPINSIKDCYYLLKEPSLGLVLISEAYFYFVSALAVLLINDLGETQLGYSLTKTGLLAVALMTGICAGAMLAGRGTPLTWQKSMVPSGAAMGLGLALSGFVPLLDQSIQFPLIIIIYVGTGFAGGIYLIPLTSFIQVRPYAAEKGRVLGISGFASFTGIIFSGICYNLLAASAKPSIGLIISGIATIIAAILCFLAKNKIQYSKFRIDPALQHDLAKVTLSSSIFTSNKLKKHNTSTMLNNI